jgi:hypothetical protein
MIDTELSPEIVRLLAEVSAAADYDAAMAIVSAFDWDALDDEQHDALAQRVLDALEEHRA